VSMKELNTELALLNTKWDESVAPITQRFIEEMWDGLSPIETGDVILFQAFPLACTDKMKKWALRDLVLGLRAERVFACADLPWLSLQALSAEAVESWLKSGALTAGVSIATISICCCYLKFWVLVTLATSVAVIMIAAVEFARYCGFVWWRWDGRGREV